jgi:hypothetical protein
MYLKAVAMDQLIDSCGRLFRSIGIQLDPVSTSAGFPRDLRQGPSVPDARIDRRARRSGVMQTGPDSTGFGQR